MKDFTKSTGASAGGSALPAPRLDSKKFTRWLLILLALTASLLSIALFVEHRGVSRTQQDLAELQSRVGNKLTKWFDSAPEPQAPPAVPSSSGPVWAETPAAKHEHSEEQRPASAAPAGAATAVVGTAAPQIQEGVSPQARTLNSCGASSGPFAGANEALVASLLEPMAGVLGKALSIAMLLVGLALAVVRGMPMPAVTGVMGATFLGLGPSVMLSVLGCL